MSPLQFTGDNIFSAEATDPCVGYKTNAQMSTYYSHLSHQILDPMEPSLPCGLAVKHFPRDQFSLFDSNYKEMPIIIKDLSFPG
jgi:hypothetical protein